MLKTIESMPTVLKLVLFTMILVPGIAIIMIASQFDPDLEPRQITTTPIYRVVIITQTPSPPIAPPSLPDVVWSCLHDSLTMDDRNRVIVRYAEDGMYGGVPITDYFLWVKYDPLVIRDQRETGLHVHVRYYRINDERGLCTFPVIDAVLLPPITPTITPYFDPENPDS